MIISSERVRPNRHQRSQERGSLIASTAIAVGVALRSRLMRAVVVCRRQWPRCGIDRAGVAYRGDVGDVPSWLVDRDAYRAVVVDDVRDPDRLAELLVAGAAGDVDLLDRSADQLAGWRKRYAPVREEVGEPTLCWVCYPWRRAAVRVLAPPHFDLLRLDRNRNKITLAEQERFRRVGVAVVGLSVGHVIAHTLVLEGLCGRITLADFDEIELSNLNRIPASLLDLG